MSLKHALAFAVLRIDFSNKFFTVVGAIGVFNQFGFGLKWCVCWIWEFYFNISIDVFGVSHTVADASNYVDLQLVIGEVGIATYNVETFLFVVKFWNWQILSRNQKINMRLAEDDTKQAHFLFTF